MKDILLSRKGMLAILLIGVAVVTFWVKYHHRTLPLAQDSVRVDVSPVKQGSIAIEAHTIGTLTAAKTVSITPEIAGHVAKILFQDGTFVKAGTPLIQLDDTMYKAQLDSAKATLAFSKANYQRNALLGKRGAVSAQAIEQAQADFKEKEATAEESQVTVDKMLLTAPFDGVLGQAKVNPGNYVQVGQELVTLTDKQHLRVEYSVSEQYLPQLKLGQEVKITTSAYPEKEFIGKVAFVSPTINPEDRTIALYADVPNEQGLLAAGLFVNVTQLLGVEDAALLIPAISLVPTIDGQQVYKVVNNKAIAAPVTIGQRTQETVQITKGLARGDCIVITGQQKLKDQMLVESKSPNECRTNSSS